MNAINVRGISMSADTNRPGRLYLVVPANMSGTELKKIQNSDEYKAAKAAILSDSEVSEEDSEGDSYGQE